MPSPRSVRRSSYWRSVFEQHAESCLSIRRFCQQNGISQSTFYAWRKKLNQESSLASSGRTGTSKRMSGDKSSTKQPTGVKNTSPSTRRDDPQASNSTTSFVAVKFPAASELADSEPIEVVHPLGYVVRVGSGANLDCLARIFQILDQRAAK